MPEAPEYSDNFSWPLVRKASSPNEQRDWFDEYKTLVNAIDATTKIVSDAADAAQADATTAIADASAATAVAGQAQTDASAALTAASEATDTANNAEAGVADLETYQALLISATLEPTGFTDNENIVVTYNAGARTISLSGTYKALYRGTELVEMENGWTSSPHDPAPTNTLYLKYNGAGFSWSSSPWNFSELQIAYVCFKADTTFCFGQREVHGFQPWVTHRDLHKTIGTFRDVPAGGGDVGGFVLASTVAAERRPTISACTLFDEDLKSVLAAHTSENAYTFMYLSGATGVPDLTKDDAEIVDLNGAIPLWNEFTGGVWTQADAANNSYVNVWLIAIPATADSDSQKARFVFMAGQSNPSTAATAGAETVQDINFGDFSGLSPEFTVIQKITLQYTGGNWQWYATERLEGSRAALTSSVSGSFLSTVSTTEELSGDGTGVAPLGVAAPAHRPILNEIALGDGIATEYTVLESDEFKVLKPSGACTPGGGANVRIPSALLAIQGFRFFIQLAPNFESVDLEYFDSGGTVYRLLSDVTNTADTIHEVVLSDGQITVVGMVTSG